MLRSKVIILSVMTSLSLSACSKEESTVNEASTVTPVDTSTAQSTKVLVEPDQEVAAELVETAKVEEEPELLSYTVSNGEYSEQCGFKNTTGDIVVKAEYDFCGGFNEGMAYLLKNDPTTDSEGAYLTGYVNSLGELVIPVDIAADYGWFLDVRDFSEGLVAVLNKDKWGYMDKEANTVIPFRYESASDFSDGIATVSKDYKYGAINHSGKTVIDLKYSQLNDFNEGLAAFASAESDKRGFINTKGKVIVAPTWDQAMNFSEGLAAVAKGDYENAKWGFIDSKGKVVIEPKYDHAFIDPGGDSPDVIGGYFENGTITVYQDGENGQITAITIDKTGKELKRKSYENYYDLM